MKMITLGRKKNKTKKQKWFDQIEGKSKNVGQNRH
jgi:hypothetical protein